MSNRQLARDQEVEFQARFHAKQARREATKARADAKKQEKEIKTLLKEGKFQKVREKAGLLLSNQEMADQLDRMADMADQSVIRIKTNNSMNRMNHMLASSSRTMQIAQKNMNPERTLQTLDRFREQNEEYAVSSRLYQDAMQQTTNAQVPADAAQELIARLADEAGVELDAELNSTAPATAEPAAATVEPTAEEEDVLQQRLRALRA